MSAHPPTPPLHLSHPSCWAPLQVLLRWGMQRGCPVIPKTSNLERLEENIAGAFSWRLSNEQKATLDALDAGKRFIDYDWKDWGDVEEGGVPKPSRVLAATAAEAAAAAAGGSAQQ